VKIAHWTETLCIYSVQSALSPNRGVLLKLPTDIMKELD